MYRDEWKLIVTSGNDGGDSAQRAGTNAVGLYLNKRDKSEPEASLTHMLQYEVEPGLIVRHPHQERHARINSTSRDQIDPFVIGLGFQEFYDYVERLWIAFKSRGFKYQNRDIAQIQSFSVFARARRKNLWVCWLSDWGLVWNAFFIAWHGLRNSDDTDDINHILRLIQARHIYPTPVSWLARKLYKAIRPHSNGSSLKRRIAWFKTKERELRHPSLTWEMLPPVESEAVQGTLTWYFSFGGNPELGEKLRHEIKSW